MEVKSTSQYLHEGMIRDLTKVVGALDPTTPPISCVMVGANAAVGSVCAELLRMPEGTRALALETLLYRCQDHLADYPDSMTYSPEQFDLGRCLWFAGCDRPATHREPHPILGLVPACDRCPTIGRVKA